MATHDTRADLPVDLPVDLPSVDIPTSEETPKNSDQLRYTTEQLLNIKLETDRSGQHAIANDVQKALVDIGLEAPKVEQPKPSVTFASEKKDEKKDNGLDDNLISGENETTDTNLEEDIGVDKKSVSGENGITYANLEEDDGVGEELVSGENGITDTNLEEDKPKKKKKKKSSRKNRPPPPSGFEEFYADPPMTPDEYELEKNQIYDSDKSFVERIETCIQNYRARRKLDSERHNIFTKYLVLGGIDAGMKPFSGGLDKELLATGTKDEIARFAATDYIGSNNIRFYDAANPKHWVVDFEGVVKGFLSYRAPRLLGAVTKLQIATCCGVIRNFLNYVLVHGVCPEYTQEVMNARILCDKAEKEMWAIRQVGRLLPGSFNIACSTLFGGCFKGMYVAEGSPWGPTKAEIAEFGPHFAGMPQNEAERMVKTAIALMGSEEMSKAAASGTIYVVKEETRSFEIVEIIRADPKAKDAYAAVKDTNNNPGGMKPLGIMRVQHFENPDCDEEDCSDDGTEPNVTYDNEEFWIEDDILELCFIGMKMKTAVHELNIGLKYFDATNGLYCSFLTILPNEKMDSWKEPTLNTRGPPTVENPEIPDEVEDFPEGDDDEADSGGNQTS